MWGFAVALGAEVPLTPEARCALAEVAVVARVEAVSTEVGAGGRFERVVTLAVERGLRAGSVPAALSVVSLGGTVGGVTQWVEDQPDWVPGQRYLVFALRWQGAWRPVDGASAVPLPPPERDPTGRLGAGLVAKAEAACAR